MYSVWEGYPSDGNDNGVLLRFPRMLDARSLDEVIVLALQGSTAVREVDVNFPWISRTIVVRLSSGAHSGRFSPAG